MKRIGITGQNGFIGKYLYNTIGLYPMEFEHIEFVREYFEDESKLDAFVSQCDVIVHLAALNRHSDSEVIFATNIDLVHRLVCSLKRTNSKAHVLMSSSTQEERGNPYGKSKRKGRELLNQWAQESNSVFTGLMIPNVFGPFGRPFYNSVVATFCHQISRGESPKIEIDGLLKLIYVDELVHVIIDAIRNDRNDASLFVAHTAEVRVSEILSLINGFRAEYQDKGEIPSIPNDFQQQLFNTYRCYMDVANYFPKKVTQHTDERGSFVEVIRLGIGGQVSFSTTVPRITRGNHFHTRKIERFTVIKAKALIQLRKIGTDEVLDFYLDGEEPAYVDMPIWYTHNIKNIGDEILYTNFWINEPYNPEDADTYFEEV